MVFQRILVFFHFPTGVTQIVQQRFPFIRQNNVFPPLNFLQRLLELFFRGLETKTQTNEQLLITNLIFFFF